MKFAVFVGKTETGYCAHSPDVKGVVATGATYEETVAGYKEALEVYLKHARESGGDMPVPTYVATTVEVGDDVA